MATGRANRTTASPIRTAAVGSPLSEGLMAQYLWADGRDNRWRAAGLDVDRTHFAETRALRTESLDAESTLSEVSRPGEQEADERELEELRLLVSGVAPREKFIIAGEYDASDIPVVAETNIMGLLAENCCLDLIKPLPEVVFERLRTSLARGEKAPELTRKDYMDIAECMRKGEMVLPPRVMQTRLVKSIEAAVRQESAALMAKIAAGHKSGKEISVMARTLAKRQIEGSCKDGIHQLLAFVRKRSPDNRSVQYWLKEEERVRHAEVALGPGESARISLDRLEESIVATIEGLRLHGRGTSIVREITLLDILCRSIENTKNRKRAARAERALMRLEEHVDDGCFDDFYTKLVDVLDKDIDSGVVEHLELETQAKSTESPQKQKAPKQTVAMAATSTTPPERPGDYSLYTCIGCKKLGHLVESCPSVERKRANDGTWTDIRCYNCGAFGHTRPKCPEPKSGDSGDRLNGGGPRQTGESAAGRKP